MRYVVRGLLGLIGVVAVIVVLTAGYFWLAAYRAVPHFEGARTLAGIAGPVTIARDDHGIPLITAASEDDAYFALGYVHAQERLFQMELMRRQGAGRLSELIGSLGLAPDRQMRTLGVYRRAEADLADLDAPTRAAFDHYAAGVNAWLAEDHPLPFEYALLMFKPEPWKPSDSLVWQKLMGLQLSGNWNQELFQAALVAKLGPERAATLTPGPKKDHPVTMTQAAALYDSLAPEKLLAAMTKVLRPTMASNEWVLAGSRTQSGKPILANDPHLGFQAPSVWYLAAIDTPTLKIFGATVPGVPFHMLGHTDHVAWGLTTPESDTADLFIEQVSGDTYQTPDGPKPFETRTETINVRFGEPVTLTVRETRHGPVVSDILNTRNAPADMVGSEHVLALSAALFQPGDRSGEGVYRVNHAQNAAEFIDAIKLFNAPHQNMVFADTDGAIGYYSPGRIPIRKAGDGSVPVPGWTGEYDWIGWIPFEDLPHDINPAGGMSVNANNKMIRDDYPYLISAHWYDSYRAARISELLQTTPSATLESVQAVQQDITSLMVKDMMPLMLAHMDTKSEGDRAVLDALKAWDGTANRDRPEPLIFALWVEGTKAAIFADELGDLYRQFGGLRPELLTLVLTTEQKWCDDVRTPQTETCDQAVAAGWREALGWMNTHKITKPMDARWGDFHVATFGHLFLSNLPVINSLGTLSIPSSGDNFTVNRGTFAPAISTTPFRHVHGASLRAVYDLSDLSRSKFTLPGGESGHLLSPHYGDLLQNWRDGVYFEAPTAATATHKLTLAPPRS